MTKQISGVFLHLSEATDRVRTSSRKWKVAFVSLSAFALIVVGGLIGLSVHANSGLGLPVVLGTFGVALAFFTIWVYFKMVRSQEIEFKRGTYLRLSVVFLVLAAAVLPVSFLVSSENPYGFWQVVVSGGLVLTVLLFLLYEGYPRLEIYGSPGYFATAGMLIVLSIIYMTVISYWIVPYNPFSINVGGIREPPNPDFPLGTTSLGQDMLSRVIAGGATMLQVAVLSVIVCFAIGVPIGLISAYHGGNLDRAVGLAMDSIFAFPGLVLAIAISAILGAGVVNMAIAIAVVYIPSYFRVVRSQVMTVRELPYVEAAVVMGAKDRHILLRYILPNVLPSAIVIMSINFADAILTAAGLTFVGLGLPVDIADWGWDLTLGFDVLTIGAWWVSSFPGLMIVFLALGFTLTGDGLNEILTPKLRE